MYKSLVKKRKKDSSNWIRICRVTYCIGICPDILASLVFDINEARVEMMKNKIGPFEGDRGLLDLKEQILFFTTNIEILKTAHFFVVAVPTDIDEHKVPNLTPSS